MRLPLVPKDDVTAAQRPLYEAFTANVEENFPKITTMTPDGALLGPWGVWIQRPSIGTPMMQLIQAIRALPGLSPAAQQVAILLTAAKYDAAYEIYAHSVAAADAGLSQAQIVTLLAGNRPSDLDDEAALSADVTTALLAGGPLPAPLYSMAHDRLGQDGLDALIFTVAQYSFVAVMLNAFDVSSPADVDHS